MEIPVESNVIMDECDYFYSMMALITYILLTLTSGAKGSPPSPLTVAISTKRTPCTGIFPRSRRRCFLGHQKTKKLNKIFN